MARTGVSNTKKMWNFEHIFEPESLRMRSLVEFDAPAKLGQFKVMTDQDMGGKSTASFRFDEELGCAVFEGALDLTPGRDDVQNSGFAAIMTDTAQTDPMDLQDFDALLIKARTDGRIYVTNLRAASVIEDDMWQAYTIGKKDEWHDIVIPFSDFIATHRGFVEGQIELDTRAVEAYGILMAQRRAGPFRLELKSIAAINSDLFELPGKRWTGVTADRRTAVD